MVDESIVHKRGGGSTNSQQTREGDSYSAAGGCTSESTVVKSATNLLISSSSTSTNEFSNKTNEHTPNNYFENIISNYQDDRNDETSYLDDEKFDEKIDNTNNLSDMNNNSFDFLNSSSCTNNNLSISSKQQLADELVPLIFIETDNFKESVSQQQALPKEGDFDQDSSNTLCEMGMLILIFGKSFWISILK